MNKAYVQTKSKLTGADLAQRLYNILEGVCETGQQYQTKSDSIPSAPNTSVFRASRSGVVNMDRNVVIYGEYGSHVMYPVFLKIGGALSIEHKQLLRTQFIDHLTPLVDEVATENTHIECSDGTTVSIRFAHGTNWGGIGYRVS
jgi:hypothetical protein